MSAVLSVATIQWVFYSYAIFTLASALVLILMRSYFD
jgi:hypothetical protein